MNVRYLIPAGRSWQKRLLLVLAFVFMDYLVTAMLCRSPQNEATVPVAAWMRMYGIFPGLTAFFLLNAVIPLYAVITFVSHIAAHVKYERWVIGLAADLAFAVYIGGGRMYAVGTWLFNGAQSMWYIGTVLYLLLAFLINISAVKAALSPSTTEVQTR
jgi:hypothetical protein